MSAVSSRSDRADEDRLPHRRRHLEPAALADGSSSACIERRPVLPDRLPASVRSAVRMASCSFSPASISSCALALPFFLLVARFRNAFSCLSRSIRSGLAWKLSRSGRSTVILR